MDKKIIILASMVFMASCNMGQNNPIDNNVWQKYSSNEGRYTLSVPKNYAFETDDEDGIYYGYSEDSEYKHMYVQTYDNLNNVQCSSAFIGIKENKAQNHNIWGKIDTMRYSMHSNLPSPICEPIRQAYSEDNIWIGSSDYAFCSENNGKIVLICISQMEDNPELAEEIFSTFEWLD
jgi:hypothetical protein